MLVGTGKLSSGWWIDHGFGSMLTVGIHGTVQIAFHSDWIMGLPNARIFMSTGHFICFPGGLHDGNNQSVNWTIASTRLVEIKWGKLWTLSLEDYAWWFTRQGLEVLEGRKIDIWGSFWLADSCKDFSALHIVIGLWLLLCWLVWGRKQEAAWRICTRNWALRWCGGSSSASEWWRWRRNPEKLPKQHHQDFKIQPSYFFTHIFVWDVFKGCLPLLLVPGLFLHISQLFSHDLVQASLEFWIIPTSITLMAVCSWMTQCIRQNPACYTCIYPQGSVSSFC